MALAIVVGTAWRAWYIFHWPTLADEAVVGLMAQQILHGHFSAFYWGNVYGGVEPYLVAPFVAVFGPSTWTLAVVPVLLSGASAVVTWRIARRLVCEPSLAALAGAAVWAVPQTAVFNSTVDTGFRGVTLLCGVGLVLVGLRVSDGHRTWGTFVTLGLVAGVGWWSSPEIVYYVVPAAFLIALTLVRAKGVQRWRHWGARLLVVLSALVLGAVPWVWANVRSGFSSLNTKAIALPPEPRSYVGHLHIFFGYMLPMLFSLKAQMTGAWLFARPHAHALFVALMVACGAAALVCLVRDDKGRALAVGVVGFPFLLALSPATWYWGDGRYADLGEPLVIVVLVAGVEEAARRVVCRHSRHRDAMAVVAAGTIVAGLMTLSALNFATFIDPVTQFAEGWGNPNGPSLVTVSGLESGHVRFAYADYWVAYKLDYLSDGRLQITTIGNDVDRWQTQHQEVRRARAPAWVFTTNPRRAGVQFGPTGYIEGPDGISEARFLDDLSRLGVGYRVVRAGLVQAVIPTRAVAPNAIDDQSTASS